MLRRCPAAADAGADLACATRAAAGDSAPRDRARGVTPSDTPGCKNAGRSIRVAPKKSRNSPDDRTAVRNHLRPDRLGAGPRTPEAHQLMRSEQHEPADAGGNAAAERGAARGPGCCYGNAGSPWSDANAALRHGT